MMMLYNTLFTKGAARSLLLTRQPSLLCMALASLCRRKRSGFTFPCTDRVTRLVNSKHKHIECLDPSTDFPAVGLLAGPLYKLV